MTWQNNPGITSKRCSAALVIDILTGCSCSNRECWDIYWGKWNHNPDTSFSTQCKEKKLLGTSSPRSQSITKVLGKWSLCQNKAQKNTFIELTWHLQFACLEERYINIHTGDQNQKPTTLPRFCSTARLHIFHSPMLIYSVCLGSHMAWGRPRALGKNTRPTSSMPMLLIQMLFSAFL